MANKRQLKKALNNMIFDVVDECFSAQLYNEKKKGASDKLIDDAADFLEQTLSRISAASSKAEFRTIREDIESKADELFEAVNKL